MASGEKTTGQRKLRESARSHLALIEEIRGKGQWPAEETLLSALRAVIAASDKAQRKTTREFAGRLARGAVVIGDLDTEPEAVKLWRPFGSATEKAIRRDGQVIDTSGKYRILDVVSHSDTCCVSFEQIEAGSEAWRNGEVLLIDAEDPINCPALLLPRLNVPAGSISEALSRHFDAPVSPVALVAENKF